MAEILHFLDGRMETPGLYGTFHLTAFALVILITLILCIKGKNVKDRTFRKIVFIAWIILVLFETYKQINFSFNYNDGKPYWDYQWYAFPFQMCSAPLYLLPFVFLSKPDGAVRKAVCSFLSFWILFAGLAVMFYPGDVFITTIGINIQTMVWHGTQVILGVYFIVYYRKRVDLGYFMKGFIVFLLMICAATALNLIVPNYTSETFNMFYISPKFPSTLPILSMIYTGPENPPVPWPVFLAIYIVGYTLAAFLVYIIAKGFISTFSKKRTKKAA
ncbi:MAG: YwaF family protein [Clostridia bacterium]|nr:YwaF family protein [Clostridia bacterium]